MPYPSKTNQEEILAAAIEIVERDGVGALSLREIARRLGLAPNALYHHFADRGELEAEIAAEGFKKLLAAIKRAAGRGVSVGPNTIIRTSQAYLRFARTRPALYQLMVKKHPPSRALTSVRAELSDFSRVMFGWMSSPEAVGEANFAFFALLHGIVTLEREGMMDGDLKRDPTNAISALLAGLSPRQGRHPKSGYAKSKVSGHNAAAVQITPPEYDS